MVAPRKPLPKFNDVMWNTDQSGLPDPDRDRQFYDGVPLRRFMAYLVYLVIVLLITAVLVVITLGVAAVLFWVFSAVASFLYRWICIKASSATLGMRIMGIELRNGRGDRLSGEEAAWHTGLFILASVFVLPHLFSLFLMATSRRGSGLHDMPFGATAINRPL